jgi:hypothetical protein
MNRIFKNNLIECIVFILIISAALADFVKVNTLDFPFTFIVYGLSLWINYYLKSQIILNDNLFSKYFVISVFYLIIAIVILLKNC